MISGLKILTEIWTNKPPKDLERSMNIPEKIDTDAGLARLEKSLDDVVELRAILCTQPRLTAISKKKPEIIEVKIAGGTIKDQLEYAKNLLGKTIKVSDIFKAGQFLDIIGVTKGKGIQGPVKRFGVKVLQKKSRKVKRKPATLGPWTPHTIMHTVPRAGQMGFHRRTEYNKKILKTGNNGKEITPSSGFHKYGVIKGDYVILAGSVIGPTKRPIILRYPARPPKLQEKLPEITYINITPVKS
jgi:large subunit ribosomal protein L3